MAILNAYLDAYLEPCPGYGWQGGPEFKTRIVPMVNGRERRNAEWDTAHHSFDAPFKNISREAYRNIKQMHLVCKGQLRCFKFRDELDYQATNEVFGEGDGSETVFQLRKVSVLDGVSYIRETYVISDSPTPVITADGMPVSPTIDYDRGLVTFLSPPANGVVLRGTWEFDIWVRFNQDALPFSIDDLNAVNGHVSLIEVSPPPLIP